MKKVREFSWIIIFMLCFVSGFGQDKQEELDELISTTKLKIHSDPIRVVNVGDSLYNSPHSDIDEKTEGLLLVADGLISLRNYPQALEYINLAGELLPAEGYTSSKIKVESRRGYVYFQLNLFDEALNILESNEEKNNGIPDDISYYNNIGYIQTVRGLIYRNMMNCEMGMRYFERALEAFAKSTLMMSTNNQSVIYYNMGNCYLHMEDYEAAKEAYQKAYDVTDVFKDDKSSLRFYARKGLAGIFIAKNEYAQAIDILKALYEEAEEIDDKLLLRSAALDLAQSYLQMEDWESYVYFDQKAKSLNKNLIEYKKEAIQKALNGIEQSENNQILKEKGKVRNEIGMISFGFLIVFGLLVWRIVRKKQNIRQSYKQIFES